MGPEEEKPPSLDENDRDFAARSFDKPRNVIWIAGKNCRLPANGNRRHNGINDIHCLRRA